MTGLLRFAPPRIAVRALVVTRSGDIQITNMRCGGRLRGGVIAGSAASALKNLVNFTTNFITKCATSFMCALLHALVGRAVPRRPLAVLRAGDSDGDGGYCSISGLLCSQRDHWSLLYIESPHLC